jgi:hypothetical protein
MALQPVYLVSAKNLGKFLEAIRRAQAPDKFVLKFIEDLGFKSTNDRLFIPLLKAMKFLDEAGKPTARYHSFLDDTQWKLVLAEGIKDAYPDLFRINRNANSLSREQLSGKIKSLSEGKVSPAVLANMTKTFLELVKLADFSSPPREEAKTEPAADERIPETDASVTSTDRLRGGEDALPGSGGAGPTLVYRIEIVLPAVRDQAIYDAIFRSAKLHLLK